MKSDTSRINVIIISYSMSKISNIRSRPDISGAEARLEQKLDKTTLRVGSLSGRKSNEIRKRIHSGSPCTLRRVSTFPRQTASLSDTQQPFREACEAFGVSVHRKRTERLNISANWQEAKRRRRGFRKQRHDVTNSATFPISHRTGAREPPGHIK